MPLALFHVGVAQEYYSKMLMGIQSFLFFYLIGPIFSKNRPCCKNDYPFPELVVGTHTQNRKECQKGKQQNKPGFHLQ
jgi:hypothetical protein